MEKVKIFEDSLRKTIQFFCFFYLVSCAGLYKDFDEKVMEAKDFDEKIKVEELPPTVQTTPVTEVNKSAPQVVVKESDRKIKKGKEEATATASKTSVTSEKQSSVQTHLPEMEDAEGFVGRRPAVDPFRVGESVTYAVSYFAVEAGIFTMGIKSMVEVNGRKAYFIHYTGKTSSLFDMFYAVNDEAKAYLDYETLVPQSYSLHVKESKQVREVRSYFNLKEMKAYMWDKKQKKGKELEEKKYDWEILPYSQNVFTVAYYMRAFTYKVGKQMSVRVAHEGKNMVMRATVVREEKLNTPAGTFDTWVIKPEFQMEGIFKPVGDVFIWLTKDDRKLIVRIESKIKIGKIVVGVQKINL